MVGYLFVSGQTSVNGSDDQVQPFQRTGVKCEDDQMDFLRVLKQVFDDGQNCAPCPACDTTVKGKLHEAELKLRRKQATFQDLTAGKFLHIFLYKGTNHNHFETFPRPLFKLSWLHQVRLVQLVCLTHQSWPTLTTQRVSLASHTMDDHGVYVSGSKN